ARLAGLRAAVPPGGEMVLESTPNGAGGIFYDEWQRAAETGFQQHFFPWFMEPGYALRSSCGTAASAVHAGRSGAANCEPRIANCESPAGDAFTAEEIALMARYSLTPAQLAFRRDMRANFRRLASQE